MCDQHRRAGGRHRGHVVVLGDPVAGVAQPVGGLRELRRRRQSVGRRLVGAHRDEVENGKLHIGVNASHHESVPAIHRRNSCQHCGLAEDVVEHRRSELAGEGVLLAGVVAPDQRDLAVWRLHRRRRAVPELRHRTPDRAAGSTDHVQRRPPRETAERDDDPHVGTGEPPLGVQPRRTCRPLGRGRCVRGWRTAHRGHHPSIVERQPIRGVDAQRLVG